MDSKKILLKIIEETKEKFYINKLLENIENLTEIEKKQIRELVKGGIKNV